MTDFGSSRDVDGKTYIRCAVVNTMMALDVPSRSLPIIMAEAHIVEPLWPLGLHYDFGPDGMTIGLYGLTAYGRNDLWTTFRRPSDLARMGTLYFSLWQVLKDSPRDMSEFTLDSLMRASAFARAS